MKHLRLLFLFCLCFLGISSFAADNISAILHVKAGMTELEYIRGEELTLKGIIQNSGSEMFIVDSYGEYTKNAVYAFVRNSETGRLLSPANGKDAVANILPRFMLRPGQAKEFTVDLRSFYDLNAQGRYQVTVQVVHGNEIAMARSFSFSVVEGLEITAAIGSTRANERRNVRFSLITWDRNKTQYLFLRAIDPQIPKNILGFVSLGPVVRVAEPTLSFENGEITVVQQTSRDHFQRTRFSLNKFPLELLSRESNLLSFDAMQEGLTTDLINRQISERQNSAPQDNSKNKKKRTPVAPSTGTPYFSRH